MACTLLDVVQFLCTVSNEFILSTKKMLLAFRFDLSIKRKKNSVDRMWSNYFYKWFSKQINKTSGFELGLVRMKKKKNHVNTK